MNTNDDKVVYRELSYRVIGLAMDVHNRLGGGFLEKVYENALMVLFKKGGVKAQQQAQIKVFFEGEEVGYFIADILVEGQIILELKVADCISDIHRAQALNYLKATGLRLAIILNFGKRRLEYERLVF